MREKAPDCKESMEIGRDWDSTWKNQWPSETTVPGFKQNMLDFYEVCVCILVHGVKTDQDHQTCHELHVQVMRSIALGLDLQERFFDDKIDEKCHNLRLLSYPAIKSSLLKDEEQARAGAHSGWSSISFDFHVQLKALITDYGTLTLLFQDGVGGLEVQNPHSREFVPATPIVGLTV